MAASRVVDRAAPEVRRLRPWFVRYPRLTAALVAQHLKALAASRLDFFIGIGATVLIEASGLALLAVVFSRVHHLQGWSHEEVLFIYGLAAVSRALYRMFFSNAKGLDSAVMRGGLDKHLTRPVNVLFGHMLDIFQPNGFGELAVGVVILAVVSPGLGVVWTPLLVVFVVLSAFSGCLVYCGVTLATACSSFWIFNSRAVTSTVFLFHEFSRYPISIYGDVLRLLLTWVVPFAFTSYFPAASILRPDEFAHMGLLTPVIGLATFAVGYRIWLAGLRRYQSAGW